MSKKQYPKIISQNRALCKAVSLLPTSPAVSVPAAYIKALPMVVGVMTIIVLLILPTTRNFFINFSKGTSENFSNKTLILKNQMALSLESGVSAYISQLKNNINILPINHEVDSQNYLGRVEVRYLREVKADSFSEKAHFMTATISQGFDYFK